MRLDALQPTAPEQAVDAHHFSERFGLFVIILLGEVVASADLRLRPIVILLDLKLPRRSGFEVLSLVKAHPELRRIPVVILTSSREQSDLKQAYDLGANSFLVKPSQPQALHTLVEQVNAYWLGHNEVAPIAL